MRKALLAPTFAALLAGVSAAQTQIPLPPFASTYSYATHTRGMYFVAPVDFIITSVEVPDESKHGLQNVAIANMGQVTSPTGTITATELQFYKAGVKSGAPIPCQVSFKKGDMVCILGACGDSTTMHNSYGGGSFASNVLGQPVTLKRLVHQFNLVTSQGLGAISDGTTGSIGRVIVTVTPPKGLFPEFDADKTIGSGPLTVKFTDKTFTSDPGGVKSWAWDFDGDAKTDSTVQNPTYTYPSINKNAKYSVSLTVTDAATPAGKSLTKKDFIEVDPKPVADFDASPRSGAVRTGMPPLLVTFTDKSIGATSWAWDFNNDTIVDSTAQNPVFPFIKPGKYTVSLEVSGVGGKTKVTKPDFIEVRDYLALTTLFAGGNGLSGGAGCFFDIDVKAKPGIWVTGFDLSPYTQSTAFTAEIYTTPSTYVGKQTNASAWTLVGAGSGTSAATRDVPNPVDTGDFFLPTGKYGMFVFNNGAGHSYTNGDPTNMSYSNNDIALSLGESLGGLFTGTPFTPRIWNGTIKYVTRGWPSIGVYGEGCKGTNGVPSLTPAAQTQAGVGQTVDWEMSQLPTQSGAVVVINGFSKEKFGGVVPLPLQLGSTGCSLLTDYTFTFGAANVQGKGKFSLPIPNDTRLIGIWMMNQLMMVDVGANAWNLSFSNGTEMIIGS